MVLILNFLEQTLLDRITDKIEITSHKVALAKGFIINYAANDIQTNSIVNEFIGQQGYGVPPTLVDGGGVDMQSQIEKIGGYYSFYIAFSEAVWGLVNTGDFLTDYRRFHDTNFTVHYTTISGGVSRSSELRIEGYNVSFPLFIRRPFSRRKEFKPQYSNPDYYILEYKLSDAHSEVIEAIKDALDCFNKELYRPATMMLGKAVEGSWIELGISLANHLPEKDELIEKFQGPDSFAWKVNKILNIYSSNQAIFKPFKKASGVSIGDLNIIQAWTDVVRDSRNSIHFGAKPTVENTYEKTSLLFITAAQYLQSLYQLKATCDNA